MDAEIPELGSGSEPVDCPIWRTAYKLPIRKSRNGAAPMPAIPALFLIRLRRHSYYCQNFPTLFQRPGVGSAHKKAISAMSYLSCPKFKEDV